jgi:type II secretory pathway component PulF
VGEEAGTLERSLLQVADEYSKEIERTLKTLTRLVEPAMILLMGLIVGFIVISLLLPIFQIDLLAR